jgi:hypothetical protein
MLVVAVFAAVAGILAIHYSKQDTTIFLRRAAPHFYNYQIKKGR